MPSDPQDRATDVIVENTKSVQQMIRRVDSLERKFEALEVTLNTRMGNLETEMGTMNAHLDNLVREAQTTNQLLREEGDSRKKEAERRQKLEDEEREHKRRVEKEQRETQRKIGGELWGILKQPLGFLVVGVVGWLLYHYFYVPKEADPASAPPPIEVKATE